MTNVNLHIMQVIFAVACIITGEVGIVPSAGCDVAQVAYNRLEDGRGYSGWNAIAETPEDWAIATAWEAYWYESCDAMFALSESDITMLGFKKEYWENVSDDEQWPVWIGDRWE